jgi:peptide deformylase
MNWKLEDLQLIHFADERMTTKPPLFDFEKDGDKATELGDVLYKKMLDLGGMGLSANQVGLPYRVFVFGNAEQKYVLFNPVVIGVSKEQDLLREGCLSFPDLMLTLQRPKEVVVEFQDETGTVQRVSYKNLAARVVLHEYDHMEGINFTHHASNEKLRWELNKLKKKQQKLQKKLKRGMTNAR